MKLLCYFPQWYAIALSIVGDYEGTKAKLENAKIMKKHFEVRHNTDSKAALSNSVYVNLHNNPLMHVHGVGEVYLALPLTMS